MYCTNCGEKMELSNKFCSECGQLNESKVESSMVKKTVVASSTISNGSSVNVIVLIVVSLLSGVCFFIPWIESSAMLSYFFSGASSGKEIIGLVSDLLRGAGRFDEQYLAYSWLIKVYYLIPLLPVVLLVMHFSSSAKESIISFVKTSAIVNIVLALLPWFYFMSDTDSYEVAKLFASLGIGYYGLIILSSINLYLSGKFQSE